MRFAHKMRNSCDSPGSACLPMDKKNQLDMIPVKSAVWKRSFCQAMNHPAVPEWSDHPGDDEQSALLTLLPESRMYQSPAQALQELHRPNRSR
jgi:hypothetical protein